MKYVFPSIVETLETLKKTPSLILVFILMHFLPLAAQLFNTPFAVNLGLMFISLGWYAAGYYYIYQALREKKLDWVKLPKKVFKYGLLLLPVLLAFAVVTVLPFVTLALVYGRWYAATYLESGLGLTTQEVLVNFFSALFNPYLWIEFFTQNWYMTLLYQLYQIMVIVGILWAKLSGLLLVIEKFSVTEAVIRALYYLQVRRSLIVSFVLLRVIGNLVVMGTTQLLVLIRFIPLEARSVVIAALIAVVGLTLDTYLVAYYTKADKRNFMERNLLRWWRSKGRDGI